MKRLAVIAILGVLLAPRSAHSARAPDISPLFFESEIDRLQGWKALFLALRPLPSKRGHGVVSEQRELEATLDAGRRVLLSLMRLDTWDDQNRPVTPFQISIGFGPATGKCQ